MISYSEACAFISKEFLKLKLERETVKLENAFNRTLAEDIYSDINMPSFDNSAVDGIAVKHNENIRQWKIIGEISAGNYNEFNIAEGEAVRIMTGAKLPDGVDTVIPIEDIEEEKDSALLLPAAKYHSKMNIRKTGSDIMKGEIAVEKGTFLRARHLAAAASCGKSELSVYKKLKFAVLATGDELVPVEQKPIADKIRVSNIYSLAGEVLAVHQLPVNCGFINDDKPSIKKTIESILNSDADIVMTTGGVSVGKYDYLREIFSELGVKEIFWRAKIKPGKPLYFGSFLKDNKFKLVFGLPGNPVSGQVNFKVYIKENVERLFGIPAAYKIKAELLNDLRKKDRKRHFLRGLLTEREGKYFVTSLVSQSSGNLVQMSKANCLIELEEERINPKAGEEVVCIPM